MALITVGAGEVAEADLLIPMCDAYTQEQYRSIEFHPHYGKMLALEVKTESILKDVESLASLRVKSPKKRNKNTEGILE